MHIHFSYEFAHPSLLVYHIPPFHPLVYNYPSYPTTAFGLSHHGLRPIPPRPSAYSTTAFGLSYSTTAFGLFHHGLQPIPPRPSAYPTTAFGLSHHGLRPI